MVRRKPKNHTDACCFSLVKVARYNAKNKKGAVYPNLPLAMRPVPHNDGLPIPSTTLVSENKHRDREIHDHSGEHDEFQGRASNGMPQLFSQPELTDLIRNQIYPNTLQKFYVQGSKLKTCLHPRLIFHGTGTINGILLLAFPKMDQRCIARTSVD
jgi:hypothetical protein